MILFVIIASSQLTCTCAAAVEVEWLPVGQRVSFAKNRLLQFSGFRSLALQSLQLLLSYSFTTV